MREKNSLAVVFVRRSQHQDDIVAVILATCLADKERVRLRPGVLSAVGAGVFRLAGLLGRGLFPSSFSRTSLVLLTRPRLPMQLHAFGL